jgi:hypothetical protein
MNLPWFSRVWVVQEAGLAKKCLLLWGDQSMDIAELIEFACFCDGCTNMTRLLGGDDSKFQFLVIVFKCVYCTYRNTASWRRSKPLIDFLYSKCSESRGLFLDVLTLSKILSATDFHDHIYAFLGSPLAYSNEGAMMLEPDYNKSEVELYLQSTRALLKNQYEAPYVLCFVQHNSAEEIVNSRYPSWVIRCRKPSNEALLFESIGNIGGWHKAGGTTDEVPYRIDDDVESGRLLSLQGIKFDCLKWVTAEPLKKRNLTLNSDLWEPQFRNSKQAYIEVLLTEISPALNLSTSTVEPLQYERYGDDLTRTLVRGYKGPVYPRDRDHRKRCKAYLESLRKIYNAEVVPTTTKPPNEKEDKNSKILSVYEESTSICNNRRLAVTVNGLVGLVPPFAQEGDICCVFIGMVTPFVLRPVQLSSAKTCYHLVGEAYIQGVMRGEIAEQLGDKKLEKTEITLV